MEGESVQRVRITDSRWAFAASGLLGWAAVLGAEQHAPARFGQHFEVTQLSSVDGLQRFHVRLPAPWSASAWTDVRNAAITAAARTAQPTCSAPTPIRVSDWMAGFAAWEVTFRCGSNVDAPPPLCRNCRHDFPNKVLERSPTLRGRERAPGE